MREVAIVTRELLSVEDMLTLAQMKAERSGIELFLKLPETLITQIEYDIKMLLEEVDDEPTS
jgi:hypothetical protein